MTPPSGAIVDLCINTIRTLSIDTVEKAASGCAGRNIHFGIREHAMTAILTGMAHHGGVIPFGATFLTFSDYMRPGIRLAALSDARDLRVDA
jgi:transketolase